MSRTTFRTTRKLKPEHREFLLAEAHKLNGGALSYSSIELLQKLFKKEFGASISSLVVHRLLVGHQNGNGEAHQSKRNKQGIRSTLCVLLR
jgi:hypothetical protein